MNLRKQLSSYIALNNYVEAIRSSQLPAGYTELEYLQSSGTQYIDTGIVNWNNTLEYEIKLSIEPQSGIKTYFGCYDRWSTSKNNVPSISTWINYKVAPNFRAGYSSSSGTDIGIINGQTGTISLKGNTISWSEGSSTSFDRGYDFTVLSSIFLFALHAGSNAAEFATTKIYRAKFWLNGELIRDFRPMLDYNNVLGMYDTVSGTFFTNSGTGSFVAGPEVYKSSIVLTDAITNGLTDLQLKGSKVKNKPEMFLDSVVAKGGTEQRNLPAEYTQVNYVTNTVITAVNTGVMIDFAKNYEFEVECSAVSGSWYILQSREVAGASITGISGSMNGSTISLVVGGISPCTSAITRTVGNKLYVKATLNNGVATLYVKDKTAGTEDTKTGSYDTSQTNPTTAMYLLGNAAGQYTGVNSDVYMARIKENDTVVMDYIPAKQDATAGFYDKASKTFKTALTPENLVAGPEVVPTPDTPIDIVSNNGALKVRHQSGLPLGYTLLEYLQTDGNSYIDTGILLSNTDVFEISFQSLSSLETPIMGAISGGTSYTSTNNLSVTYTTNVGLSDYSVYCDGAAGNADHSWSGGNRADGLKHTIKYNGLNIAPTLDGVPMEQLYTHTLTKNNPTVTTWLFGRNNTGSGTKTQTGVRIYDFNVVGIAHFVPCKNASNVVGMYDTVSGTFLTNAGTGEFIAGNPVSDPVEVYTDGTVETIESQGKNLCDSNAFQSGYINQNDGTIRPNPQWLHTDYLYIGDAETYTYSLYTSISGNAGRECAFYDKDKKFISGEAGFVFTNQVGEKSKTFTVPEGAKYIRISVANLSESQKDTKVQLEQGSTPTEYEPYYRDTATAEMLLKVGDYQDVQEMLSGTVTRKIGVKVLDGTEDWVKGQSFYCDTLTGVLQADHSCYCTHYQGVMNNSAVVADSNTCRVGYHIGSDVAWDRLYIYADRSLYATAQDFANYLAQQYAAGTPVIIVYPLNASTTETVSPQKLFKNPVYVTEASINDLEVTTTEAEHTVPTPGYPLDIMCNNGVLKAGPNNSVIVKGTPETITVTGKNLFNKSHIKSAVINDVSVVIPVKQNKTYTWSYNKTEYDFRFDSEFIWGVDLNGNKVENGVTLVYANGTYRSASYVTVTVVSPNVVALQTVFRNNTIQSTKENVLASSMQLEESIRPTKYEEYYQASFAPEDLLKLSDYQDVQSVLDGIVTRNVGVKVLTGAADERWGTSVSTKFYWDTNFAPALDYSPTLCTCYQAVLTDRTAGVGNNQITLFSNLGKGRIVICDPRFTTVAQFKQWLADQYAAGTPVIVVYPLANTVEETVESRDVFITSGTNTIERNSEYVSSDGMTVKYKKLR